MVTLSDPDHAARFVQLLTGVQSRLYAYLYTLLAGEDAARDVLQETNVALWKKASEYDFARPFEPWAVRFAHFQALAWRKRQSRDRLVFDDATVALVVAEFPGAHDVEAELRALEECLGKLPEKQRLLVERRYRRGDSVSAIAADEGKPANVVAAFLYRARKALAECIGSVLREVEGRA